jgi:predicted glycosyltransferase involved in capsule biosynthesis
MHLINIKEKEIQLNHFDLTVILPIRITQHRLNLINQIKNIFLDSKIPKNVNFLIVDDGSEDVYAAKIKSLCNKHAISYLYLNTLKKPFSLARARNAGANAANTTFIMFQDLDMMPYNGFYKDLLIEIDAQELVNKLNSFIMISTIYLTKEGSEVFHPSRRQFYIDKMLVNDTKYIQKFSSGTSLILLHKKHFLSIGGYDEKFFNWGHEDIDLNCRLILQDNLCKLPKEFSRDERNFNNIFEYTGWKSIYRLYGDRTFLKGIVLFHSWHETDQNTAYYSNKKINKKYFHQKLLQYEKSYVPNTTYQLTKDSILFDRYKYSISYTNRLKCRFILCTLYRNIKKYLTTKRRK